MKEENRKRIISHVLRMYKEDELLLDDCVDVLVELGCSTADIYDSISELERK